MKLELKISVMVLKLLTRILCCHYTHMEHRKMRSIDSLLDETNEIITEIEKANAE